MRFTDPDGMMPFDWINLGNRYFFDSSVTTQTEAVSKYGFGAVHMDEGSKLVGNAKGTNEVMYQYTFHDDGTVTDGLNFEIDNSVDLKTNGGSVIEASDNSKNILGGINDFSNYNGLLNGYQSYYLDSSFDKLSRNADGAFNIDKFSKYVSIKNNVNFIGGSLNALSYLETANDFYNENYYKGVAGGMHNTFGIYASKTPIGAAGWFIGSYLGEKLTATEIYNRVMFGENSAIYRNRSYNWYESPILK